MDPVRIGIIGCGVMGNHHADYAAQLDNVDLVAVADTRPDAAQRLARDHNLDTFYASAQDLIDDGRIEAVILALPAGVRFQPARRALEAGKHVLLEKPPAMNVAQLEELAVLRLDRVVACCSSRFRFLPSAAVAADVLARNGLGPLRLVNCRASTPLGPPPQNPPPPWRVSRKLNGGGILVNWGVYDLDYLLGIAGWSLRPKTVLARTWPVAPAFARYVAPESDAETHVVATILCENHVAIQFERGEFIPAVAAGSWQFTGETGALRLSMSPAEDDRLIHDFVATEKGVQTRVLYDGKCDWDTLHRAVLKDFAEAIRTGRPPKTSLENTIQLQRMFDAIYRSAETQVAVDLP
ncbi:MAG: Gfo/Idh/MocA family oxidoreductase [Planctomycetota bacterium]